MYDESSTQDEQKSLDYDDVTSPQYKRHASHNDLCWRQPDGKENCDSEYSHVSFSKNTSVCPLPPDLSIEKEPVDISRISIGPIPQENTRNYALPIMTPTFSPKFDHVMKTELTFILKLQDVRIQMNPQIPLCLIKGKNSSPMKYATKP